jgi:hypothetical protein
LWISLRKGEVNDSACAATQIQQHSTNLFHCLNYMSDIQEHV